MHAILDAIEKAITDHTDRSFRITDSSRLGGGCINEARCVTGRDGRRFFVKFNTLSFQVVFATEAAALRAMADTGTIRVPRPVAVCAAGDQAALVMEFLPLGDRNGNWDRMGQALAQMHRTPSATFGWESDNWIGSTPQINTVKADWIAFYGQCRLQPQISRARQRGLPLREADALLERLPGFFRSYRPPPSLLHGDLWAGNAGFLEDGTPVIFDPATYFGDREADLAMTELFGGFPAGFYEAYAREWPLDPGYRVRRNLYNLYHLLNHFNIFGGGYGAQAQSIISGLLHEES